MNDLYETALDNDDRNEWEAPAPVSGDRSLDPARPRTLTTLRRLASLKGYLPPKPGITEEEAKLAISALARLKAGPDGKAARLPAVPDTDNLPHNTLRSWNTRRP